jgi:8-amino-7-oxononanoate synthase
LPQPRQEEIKHDLDFSSNDYLNLSQYPCVKDAAIQAIRAYGVGSRASRVVCEYHPLHQELETRIAQDKGTQAALLFSSGFQTNVSVLSALLDSKVLGARPLVFCDRLNHSSIYQALFLSGCEWVRYQHGDMQHLETLLERYSKDVRPKYIISETVFGMDGDIAPLTHIHTLAQKYHACVYLDEAHATGVLGVSGYGCSPDIPWKDVSCVVMGTFSKALGASGGYIACSQVVQSYLINKAHGFIYSTGPSPALSAAVLASWQHVKKMQPERTHLQDLACQLRRELNHLGYDTKNSTTHIVPIILGSESKTLAVQEKLRERGIMVSAIRPPTVPPGTSRLRIALRASHTQTHVNTLIRALRNCI